MKNEEQIHSQVEKIMGSLDGIKSAEANPFLYTRVMQAIENKSTPVAGKLIIRLGFALLIFTAINVYTFIHIEKTNTESKSTSTGIEAFANEYGLSDNSNS